MWSTIAAERGALADDLAGLTESQWDTTSLCTRWSVRDVLAHLTGAASLTPVTFVKEIAGARFDFDRFADRRIAKHRGGSPTETLDLAGPEQRDLLERYVAAFEAHDVARLADLLCEDARASMPPFAWWLEGGGTIAALVGTGGCDGARLAPAAISGQPGFGQYRPDDLGVLRPFALVLVETRRQRIAHLTTFLGTGDRFAEFGLPLVLHPESVPATDEYWAART